MDVDITIERIVTGPMTLQHWPDCRGGGACRCAESGAFILEGVGFVRREPATKRNAVDPIDGSDNGPTPREP